MVPSHRGDELIQDLSEEFRERVDAHGRLPASFWYWAQVLRPSTTALGRELREVRTMKVGRRRRPGVAPKTLLDLTLSETRLALRSFRHRPGFSILVVMTLALGIGANTAIFTVVNGVVLQPLAFPSPEGLVVVGLGPDEEGPLSSMSLPDIIDVESQSASIASLAGYSASTYTMTEMGDPALVRATRVNKGLLSTFQLGPALGRDIALGESGASPAAVVVISHGFWRDRFQRSPDVLGETLVLDGISYQVVGVAPAEFEFPAETQVWVPRGLDPETCGRGCHTWYTIGRLAPGGSVESLQTEIDALATRLSDAYPDSNFEKTFSGRSLRDDVVGEVRTGLWLLLGAGLAVLLIACANVANLILARSEARRGEAAVRVALGATRWRLVASMLSESAFLAFLGGATGLGLAMAGVSVLRRVAADALPRIEVVSIDVSVLLFALSLVVLVTVAFGLSPALRASRTALATGVRKTGRGGAIGEDRRLRHLLTASQTALAMVLLFGAGLMLRTFAQLYAVDPGFRSEEVLRFDVQLPSAAYGGIEEIRTFYRTLETRIASLPGVEGVASIYGAPLGQGRTSGDVLVEGRPEPEPGNEIGATVRPIGPGYLSTMDIPVLRGRDLTTADDRSQIPVAVVNETFVRETFGDADPIGERVQVSVSMGFGSPFWEIVGVARDVRPSLTGEPISEIFVPQGQFGPGFMTVNVRASVSAVGLIGAVRAELQRTDANLPLRNVETVSDAIRRHMAPTRFLLVMVAAFAGLALVLAAVGLYGVMAYLVSRRVREIGVRVALGARPAEILRLMLAGGLGPAILGLVVGLGVSLAGGRIVEGFLYGVTPRDPWTLIAVPAVLLFVAVIAVLVPARRATRVDPVTVLRAE